MVHWEVGGKNVRENIANLWVSCYNGNDHRSARVLFVQHPRELGEWLRLNPAPSRAGRTTPSQPGHYPSVTTRCTSWRLTSVNWTNRCWNMANRVFDLKKHIRYIGTNLATKQVSSRITPKYNQVKSRSRGIWLSSVVVIWSVGLTFLADNTYRADKHISSLCATAKVNKCHPVHLTYPQFLYNIMVWVKLFWLEGQWRERQTSLPWRRTRKITGNIKSSQIGMT